MVGGGKKEEKRGNKKKGKRRGIWTEEGKWKFKELFGRKHEKWKDVEEGWKKLKGTVEEMLEKVEIGTIREGRKGWWDGECRKRKERVREKLRRRRNEGGKGEKREEKNIEGSVRKRSKKRKRKLEEGHRGDTVRGAGL